MPIASKKFLSIIVFSIFLNLFFSKKSVATIVDFGEINGKEYCKNIIDFNSDKIFFEIKTSNSKNWFRNLISAIIEDSKTTKNLFKIDEKYKHYFKANINIKEDNKILCTFKGRVKLHGSTKNHIDREDLVNSVRVKLTDSHILNKSYFILYHPPARHNDNEVFFTTLLKHFDIITPLSFYSELKINNLKKHKVIFQEKNFEEILFSNKKPVGILITGNKTRGRKDLSLSRISGQSVKSYFDLESYSEAISSVNKIFLSGFDYHLIKNNDIYDYKKIAIYETLISALGGQGGTEDRRYYFNPILKKIEPVYYDGDTHTLPFMGQSKPPLISQKKEIFTDKKIIIDGKNIVLDILQKINISKLQTELQNKGLKFSSEELKKIISTIKNQVLLITKKNEINSDLHINFLEKYNLFSKKLLEKNIYPLFYNSKEKKFYECKIINDCSSLKLNNKEIKKIFSEQFFKKNGKEFKFIGLKSDYYHDDKIIKTNTYKKISNNFFVKHNNNEFYYDKINKQITIKVLSTNPVIIYNSNLNGVSFKIDSSKVKNIPKYCLVFIDTVIQDISINSINSKCDNAINFYNINGDINNLKISGSLGDGFDSRYSNLIIKNLHVEDVKNNCITLKSGNYEFNHVVLKNCKDRGISIGELGKLKINNLSISKAQYALGSKDSSIIELNKADIRNTRICLMSYRRKDNFSQSIIVVNKNSFACKNYQKDIEFKDAGSEIIYK